MPTSAALPMTRSLGEQSLVLVTGFGRRQLGRKKPNIAGVSRGCRLKVDAAPAGF